MKKFSAILLAAALTVAFAACSGSKKEEAKAPETPESTVVTPTDSATVQEQAVPQEENPAESLKAFAAFVKEFAEAHNNVAKDPNKYTKLARQVQQKVADMERLKEKFTKKQEADYQKSLDLLKQVTTGNK